MFTTCPNTSQLTPGGCLLPTCPLLEFSYLCFRSHLHLPCFIIPCYRRCLHALTRVFVPTDKMFTLYLPPQSASLRSYYNCLVSSYRAYVAGTCNLLMRMFSLPPAPYFPLPAPTLRCTATDTRLPSPATTPSRSWPAGSAASTRSSPGYLTTGLTPRTTSTLYIHAKGAECIVPIVDDKRVDAAAPADSRRKNKIQPKEKEP